MFNQSLNAGIDDDYDTDLDVVPQIVETIGTGAPPELEEEAQAISAMEARVEDLLVLRAEIVNQHGMSQALAIEGLRIMPEFGDGAPVSYYSLRPGRTRLAVANESIIGGIWASIKSALAALRRMIGKFIAWVTGRSADGDKGENLDEAASATDKSIASLVKAAEEMIDVMKTYRKGTYRNREGGGPASLSFEQVFDYVQGSARNYFYGDQAGVEKLYLDLLGDGEYSKAMRTVGALCEGLIVILKQRVNLLESIVEKDLRKPDLFAHGNLVAGELADLEKPLTVSFEGHERTLDELNVLLRDLKAGSGARHESKKLDVGELYTAFSRIERRINISESIRSLRKLMPLMTTMEAHIVELETTAVHLFAHENDDGEGAMVGSALISATVKLGKDVSDLGVLAHGVLSYAAEIRLTAKMAIRLARDVAGFIVENIVDENNEAPAEWVTLMAKLQRIHT